MRIETPQGQAQTKTTRFDTGWLFGGSVGLPGPEDHLDPVVVGSVSGSDLDDASWMRVTVPHTVTPLSWELWDHRTWEKVWVYRRHFTIPPEYVGRRLFLDFDGAMTNTTVTLNDVVLGEHRGGYLPFSFEITSEVVNGDNVLALVLDSRFNLNVPPNITSAAPSSSVDYWQPGGLHREVRLRSEPRAFVAAMELTHHDVLDPERRRSNVVVIVNTIDALSDVRVDVALRERDGQTIASAEATVTSVPAGTSRVEVVVTGLEGVTLWDIDAPTLYDIVGTLTAAQNTVHAASLRTGYREARFEVEGFFLNGTRRYLMGVNRHGHFPFAGFAMPDRVQRRDAEILKTELNCAMVRCSHYPQSPAFLDACDEFGLLVWEESPGWQHVGDSDWQDLAAHDIAAMIGRDRHRPSVIVWGARLNETPDRPDFYARTEALVKSLDATRATSGTMHGDYSRSATFQHDLFSYDDYNTRVDDAGDRRPDLLKPVEGKPYLITEAVSTRSSPTSFYRRAETALVQQHQALDYAHAHDQAMGDPGISGLLAWGAFDYHSRTNNHFRGLKTGGLADTFRILKPGAAIYRAQVDPLVRIVIEPAFAWDPPVVLQPLAYGNRRESNQWGPGERAMICSNCDLLEVFLDDDRVGVVYPDREHFPNLLHPPSFVDLRLGERGSAELRIEGYLGGRLVLSRRFSGERATDSLVLAADDHEVVADGVDCTRVTAMIVDKHGNARSSCRSIVSLATNGPGVLVGDEQIDLEQTGAVAAVWVRSEKDRPGPIVIRATTEEFGAASVLVNARPIDVS